MAGYKITSGSVKIEDGHTRFMVSFIRDDKTESKEQLYEVESAKASDIYKALDNAATSFNNTSSLEGIPALITGKTLKVGEGAKSAQILNFNK